MTRLRTCPACGTPHAGTGRCAACRPAGRDDRSPTTRAQDAEYAANRATVLAGDPPCAIRTHCDAAPATTADHIVAVANGGTNELANLQPACAACNYAKQAGTAPRPAATATTRPPHKGTAPPEGQPLRLA